MNTEMKNPFVVLAAECFIGNDIKSDSKTAFDFERKSDSVETTGVTETIDNGKGDFDMYRPAVEIFEKGSDKMSSDR